MIFRFRKNQTNQIPPLVKEAQEKALSGNTGLAAMGLVFLIGVLHTFSEWLDAHIPFGKFLWIIPFFMFIVVIIKISKTIEESLRKKGTNLAQEYRTQSDKSLFDQALRNGNLYTFNFSRTALLCLISVVGFLLFLCTILSVHLIIFEGRFDFFFFVGVFSWISLIGLFIFYRIDLHVLQEAQKRNLFVDIAQKRLLTLKAVFVITFTLSLLCAGILIHTDRNFLGKGETTFTWMPKAENRY